MTSSPRIPFLRVALLACALLACAAPAAPAAQWPGFGGDAGRSGNQAVDAGAGPVELVWKRTGAGDQNVRTSLVTSGGAPGAQRVVYGTADGVVHLRRLSDGTPVGGADVGDDADVFGTPGGAASASFASTSSEDALGQLFALHNDGGEIQIAHFDEADGSLRQQFSVPGTAGMTAGSSLLATADALFFVAGGRLFKLPVANALSRDASFGTVSSTADVDANPVASPALVSLDVLGTPTPHVAIGTSDGFLRTYRASDLAPGPLIDLSFALGPVESITAADVMTPSVLDAAGLVYVAASGIFSPFPDPDPAEPADTIVYKLHIVDGAFEFQFEMLPIPDTLPGPALATNQPDVPEPAVGEVLIPTSSNLFLATTSDMDLTGEIDFDSDLVAGVDGFTQTAASVSGAHYYVANDSGQQIVGRLSDGKTVDATDFERDVGNAGAPGTGVGQPAISRGYVQFGGPDGVFVYRNRDLTPPAVALTAPAAEAVVSGSVTVAAAASDARGVEQVEFRANGRSLGIDTSAGDGFSVAVDTDAMPAGEYVLDAIASDGTLTSASEPRRVVIRARGEDAPPSVSFTRPGAGAVLSGSPTLSADAGDDRGIASVRFMAGERAICTDTAAPYDCAYRLGAGDVGRTTLVAVATDTAGQTAAALRGVQVSRFASPGVSARTTPARDRRGPFRFTTRGRVRVPAGVSRSGACAGGQVSVQLKAARKTISTRRVALTSTCAYRSRVTFRSRKRFPRSGRLTVRVRFLGNAVLGPRSAKTAVVRAR